MKTAILLIVVLAALGGALLGHSWTGVKRAVLRHPLAGTGDVSADTSDAGPAERLITAGLAVVSIVGLVVVLAVVVVLYQTIRGGA
jgi:hypothetical protein